ncbi:MAG: acyltransferase family protein [Bacteroides sp.]|nr:acyltransferase family protein [Bacteroides sp.]
MAKQRNPFWDTLKAILIVLVVLGHTGMAMGEKWLSVIYAFHMPLLIFISGYFSTRKPFRDFLGGGSDC